MADLLLRLADFFRLSVKVDMPQVPLEEELELAEAYMDLICARYPELKCNYDIDPELLNCSVPNFILQPIIENSLLHGLKSKGYRGEISICAVRSDANIELQIRDTGSGFAPEKKAEIDELLSQYDRLPPKLTGSGIGILNVQKRIKLLYGKEFRLWYTENETGGVTAHILLPRKEDVQ